MIEQTWYREAPKIPALEGLRGLLALWVVLGHWATSIAVPLRPLRQNLWAVQAVDIFIILSGFVIAMLLQSRPTDYGRYLVRRWFRIAPVFITMLLIAAVLLPVTGAILAQAPQGEMHDVRAAIQQETSAHFTSDLLLHLTLLHGLVPTGVRPYAAYAFVGQAWSISLEWQFYLLAPLFYGLARRWRQPTAAAALAALAVGLMVAGPYFGQAYIGNKLPLFALGAASYWAWRHVQAGGKAFLPLNRQRMAAGLLILGCLVSRSEALLGPALWIAVLHCLLTEPASGRPETLCRGVLCWAPVQFLGRISYTLYLAHFLVLLGGLWLLAPYDLPPGRFAAALLAYLLPVSVLAAWLVSVAVERPGMRLGKELSQRGLMGQKAFNMPLK